MPRRPRAAQRPSAALVLGVFSGLLAALIYLPTVFPLTFRVAEAEEAVALRHAAAVARAVERGMQTGHVPSAQTLGEVSVEFLWIQNSSEASPTRLGPPLPEEPLLDICESATPALLQLDGALWAVACSQTGEQRIIAAHRPSFISGTDVLYVVLLLAITVGIITALGILRLLRPISRVSTALGRLGAGERGVRMESTGLSELDELIDRLNDAAQAVESREHAITARIQVVQEMAGLVAHEIRNPLQSLELLTSLVAAEDHPAERAELARAIRQEIRTLDTVVQRLLQEGAASGGLRLHRAPEAIAALIDQVTRLRRADASKRGARLTQNLQSWRQLPIDSTLLVRCIDNLVLNAIQAVPPHSGEVRISLFEEEEWLHLIVEDNGPGIDSALSTRVFEPEVTTKPEGIGLGLTLVKGVIEAHGGYIEAGRSALGGARFVARLPLGDPDDGARQRPPADHPGGR